MQRITKTTTTTSKKGSGQSNKKKNQPKANKKRIQSSSSQMPPLSECGAKYMMAVANPWDSKSFGACVPSFPSRRSHKAHMTVRTTGVIGTTGLGWVFFAPCLSNNSPAVFTSTATSDYTGASSGFITQANITSGKVNALPLVGPHASSQFLGDTDSAPSVQGRIVSFGARVTYTGTVTNMSGLLSCYSSPDHGNLTDQSYNSLVSLPETSVSRVSQKPCNLVISPIAVEEIEYQYNVAGQTNSETLYPYNGGTRGVKSYNDGTNDIGPVIGFVYITGVAGQTFFIEAIQHVEFIGPATQSSATNNHVDRPAMEAVLNAASTASVGPGQKPWQTQIFEGTQEALRMASNAYGSIPPPIRRQIKNSVASWAMNSIGGAGQGTIELRR